MQALQECQNTKMKEIHLENQKFPPSTGRPNCQNQAVWPACVRWQTCDSLDDFFFILVFWHSYKAYINVFTHISLQTFFLPCVSFKPTVQNIEHEISKLRYLPTYMMYSEYQTTINLREIPWNLYVIHQCFLNSKHFLIFLYLVCRIRGR